MSDSAAAVPDQDTVNSAAFEFVRALAVELSTGTIELPSFSEIALRVQRVLSDQNVQQERVVRVVGSEPALAARILTMANSAALNPARKPVSDLRSAIARMGFDMLRSCAISFAMSQLRKADSYRGIDRPLRAIWERSVTVASICYVIARRGRLVNPDAALLTGLLHCVGRIYILTRANKHPRLLSDAAAFNSVVRDWHAGIAKALLEHWDMSPDLVEAVHGHEDHDRPVRSGSALIDILAVATIVASFRDQADLLEAKLRDTRAGARLQLDRGAIEQILLDSEAELRALREALGD